MEWKPPKKYWRVDFLYLEFTISGGPRWIFGVDESLDGCQMLHIVQWQLYPVIHMISSSKNDSTLAD